MLEVQGYRFENEVSKPLTDALRLGQLELRTAYPHDRSWPLSHCLDCIAHIAKIARNALQTGASSY